MTDLMNALYEYLADHTSIWNDLQYQSSNRCASAKQKQLDSQQRQLLDDLLIELQIAHSLELKHTFQKTLSLSRELSSLVRG